MRKPNGDRLSSQELAAFEEQAADLQDRLAALGLNFSKDACITIVMLTEAERLISENRHLLESVIHILHRERKQGQ